MSFDIYLQLEIIQRSEYTKPSLRATISKVDKQQVVMLCPKSSFDMIYCVYIQELLI